MRPQDAWNEDRKAANEALANLIIATSSRDWLLHLLQIATDFQAGLWMDTDHPTEKRPLTGDEVYQLWPLLRVDFQLLVKPIDLRGNIPAQLADRLRVWSERLQAMAIEVEKVPDEPYEHVPKAYVTRDADTGEVIGARMLLCHSVPLGTSYEEIMNAHAETTPDDIRNWPELAAQYDGLMGCSADGTDFDLAE